MQLYPQQAIPHRVTIRDRVQAALATPGKARGVYGLRNTIWLLGVTHGKKVSGIVTGTPRDRDVRCPRQASKR